MTYAPALRGALFSLLALGLGPACAPEPPRPATTGSPPILILSLDTLRPDRLSGGGQPRGTSPFLDALATEGTWFAEARSQSTGTLTSHLSLMTSLYPRHFRITRPDGQNDTMFRTKLRLPDAAVTLAEVLRDGGYETAAFTGGGFAGARYGLGQGFETFHENETRFIGLAQAMPHLTAFLDQRTGARAARPLFLFVHCFDVHEPYWVRGPLGELYSSQSFEELALRLQLRPTPDVFNEHRDALSARDLGDLLNLYDNGIRATDRVVQRFFRRLAEYPALDGAIVVVLSDHGEEFLEHGYFNHGPRLFDELVRVPLWIRWPEGFAGDRLVTEPVALVDVAPTLLAAVGLDVPESFHGRDLRPLAQGDAGDVTDRPVILEAPDAEFEVRGVVHDDWKLILSRDERPQLYDLAADPQERTNVAEEHADRTGALTQTLEDLLTLYESEGEANGWRAVALPDSTSELSPEQRAKLEALGYTE